MALPFETQTMQERLQDRARRARDRETWDRVTEEDELTYKMAAFIADEKDAREEAIIALGEEADGPLKAKMYTTLRQMWVRLAREYRKLSTAATYDWETAEDIYEKAGAVEGMTEEEAKLLEKRLKKNQENGKVQRRGKAKETPYQRPEENSSGATGQGPSWGWGGWPAPGLVPPMNGMVPPMGGWAMGGWTMGGPGNGGY
jgi:hypothetical protein